MKTRVINVEEYKAILTTIGTGFTYKVNGADKKFRPNTRLKMALMLVSGGIHTAPIKKQLRKVIARAVFYQNPSLAIFFT